MKGRKQKISDKETCLQKNRTASEGYVGGQTFMWITENNLTETNRVGYGLLECILSPSNLNAAYLRVKRNKGAGGVDKMQVESLKDYLVANKDELSISILTKRLESKLKEPPYTERYVRWCERTGREIIPIFLLDSGKSTPEAYRPLAAYHTISYQQKSL